MAAEQAAFPAPTTMTSASVAALDMNNSPSGSIAGREARRAGRIGSIAEA
jgi:hypothetical protein